MDVFCRLLFSPAFDTFQKSKIFDRNLVGLIFSYFFPRKKEYPEIPGDGIVSFESRNDQLFLLYRENITQTQREKLHVYNFTQHFFHHDFTQNLYVYSPKNFVLLNNKIYTSENINGEITIFEVDKKISSGGNSTGIQTDAFCYFDGFFYSVFEQKIIVYTKDLEVVEVIPVEFPTHNVRKILVNSGKIYLQSSYGIAKYFRKDEELKSKTVQLPWPLHDMELHSDKNELFVARGHQIIVLTEDLVPLRTYNFGRNVTVLKIITIKNQKKLAAVIGQKFNIFRDMI